MNAVSDPSIEDVIVIKSAQVGATELLNNVVGFYIDQDPAPMLVVMPTLEIGEAWSKDRLSPMLRDTPALAARISGAARDANSTITHKALAVDTPLATPTGWTTMGEVAVGDMVFDERGHPCRVTYVTPVVTGRPCYRVVFSDGASIIADESHPWKVDCFGKTDAVTVTTLDLLRDTPATGRKPYSIPMAGPLQTGSVDLPIDPYILGAWLGDGLSHAAVVVVGLSDAQTIDLLKDAGAVAALRWKSSRVFLVSLDPDYGKESHCPRGHDRDAVGRTADGHCLKCHRQKEQRRRAGEAVDGLVPNSIRGWLKSIGLISEKGSGNSQKHIPSEYLRASIEQRTALLQGLMDTDGSIRKDGSCVFVTTLPRLANGVQELLSSLGIKHACKETITTYRHHGAKKNGKLAFRIEFFAPSEMPIFRLSRKLERQKAQKPLTTRATRRRVVSVDPVDSVPVRCISVDSDSHLYLAGAGMVPTHNTFPGGHITIAGANSAASLASRPIRVVLCDEVDRYPASAGNEGDPVGLAFKRTTTFWNRKRLLISTPTIKGVSRIEAAWEESDKRRYFVPCPDCGTMQVLVWSQVKWPDGQPEKARYCCSDCGSLWGDADRWLAVTRGEWRATGDQTGIAGFHIWEAYSSWVKLADTVRAFLAAKDHPERLRVWVNTALGETWVEAGDAPEWQRLYDRRERWHRGTIPAGGLFLTAGADVQKDRIEVSIWAWGRGLESWLVDHLILAGGPDSAECWGDVTALLSDGFDREDGATLRIEMFAIDAIHAADAVHKWARSMSDRRVMAVVGKEGGVNMQPVSKSHYTDNTRSGRPIRSSVKVRNVNTSWFKSETYRYLRLDLPEDGTPFPSGYVHLPDGTDAEWCKQLVSEQLMTTRDRRGAEKTAWHQMRPRNEALDCRVYASAARYVMGADSWPESRWERVEIEAAGGVINRQTPQVPQDRSAPSPSRRSSDDWLGVGSGSWF